MTDKQLTLDQLEKALAAWLNLMHLTAIVALNFYKNQGTPELARYMRMTTRDEELRALCADFVKRAGVSAPEANYKRWRAISDLCRVRAVEFTNVRANRMAAASREVAA